MNERRIHLAGRFGALILLSTLPGLGQAITWEKLDIAPHSVWQDPEWKSGMSGMSNVGPRLAADASGRIYFTNGTSLLIGSEGGAKWREHFQPMDPSGMILYQHRPLAVGGAGTILWAGLRSVDGGATWVSSGVGSDYSAAVHPAGPLLAAAGNDGIARSPGPGQPWTRVHSGNTFGNIRQFVTGESGYVFALPYDDQLLISNDTGKTWKRSDANGFRSSTRSMALAPLGTPLWMAVGDFRNPGNRLVRVNIFFPSIDTMKTVLPDSAVTSMLAASDGALWIGTKGQGLFVSRDNGNTFTAGNGGLGSLYVESVAETSDRRIFALTREGLYRLKSTGTSLRPIVSRPLVRGSRASLLLPGITRSRPASGSATARISVLADGRMLIIPQDPTSPNNPSPTR